MNFKMDDSESIKSLPIGLILNDAALLDDVGEARLIQRQQTIFQHGGVIGFQCRQRFARGDELQLTADGGEVIDLVAGRIFLDEEHRFVFCDGSSKIMVGAGRNKVRRFCDGGQVVPVTRITLAAQPPLQAIHMGSGGLFPEGALCRHHKGLGHRESDPFNFGSMYLRNPVRRVARHFSFRWIILWMKFKEFLRAPKVITDSGRWSSGSSAKKVLALSRGKLNLGAQWTWRRISIAAKNHNFLVVVAFHEAKQNYHAYLALIGKEDSLVLASIQNHSTHPGWHLHVNCDGDVTGNWGRLDYPAMKRLPDGKSMHRARKYRISELEAMQPVLDFFGLDNFDDGSSTPQLNLV